jgi:hypothetical protein
MGKVIRCQRKGKVGSVIPLPNQRESQLQDIETSISLKDKVMSRVLLEPSLHDPGRGCPSPQSRFQRPI